MDPEEDQDIIDSIVNALESDEERSFSPSQTRSDSNRTYSPQVGKINQQYSIKKIQSPIIGFKLDCWTIQPFSLDEDYLFEGDMIAKCKDQNSSRKIQNLFEKGDEEQKELIFQKLLPGIVSLANDIFGNYEQVDKRNQFSSSYLNRYFYQVTICLDVEQLRNLQKFHTTLQNLNLYSIFYNLKLGILYQTLMEIMLFRRWPKWLSPPKVNGLLEAYWGKYNDYPMIHMAVDQYNKFWSYHRPLKYSEQLFSQLIFIQSCQHYKKNYPYHNMEIILFKFYYKGDHKKQSIKYKRQQQGIWRNQVVISLEGKLEQINSNVVDKSVNISNYMRKEILKVFVNNKHTFYRLSNNCYGNYVIQNFCKQLDHKQLYSLTFDSSQFNTQFGQHVLQTLQKLKN